MPRLSERKHIDALIMLGRGVSVVAVSRAFNCHRNTIMLLRDIFAQTGTISYWPRPGRPRVMGVRLDVELMHMWRQYQTATATARQYGISRDTVLGRLRRCVRPVHPRRPYTGPVLTQPHSVARMNWAQLHYRWRRADWNQVVFTDESWFNFRHNDGCIPVYRRSRERFADTWLCPSEEQIWRRQHYGVGRDHGEPKYISDLYTGRMIMQNLIQQGLLNNFLMWTE